MELKKYISKRILIRLGIFLTVIAAAWIFDYYHQGDIKLKTGNQEQETAGGLFTCYCAPSFTVSLKAPIHKVTLGKAFREKLNRLVMEHLVARSVFLSKAEILRLPNSLLSLRYLISLRCRIVNDPGDLPPLF